MKARGKPCGSFVADTCLLLLLLLLSLRTIDIANNKLKSIAGLKGLTQLVKVDLGANKIRVMDPDELSGLVNLEELWLGKNKIEKITGLEKVSSHDNNHAYTDDDGGGVSDEANHSNTLAPIPIHRYISSSSPVCVYPRRHLSPCTCTFGS